MYHFIDRLHTLYGLLQDELSKEIFQARFAVDMDPSISNVKRLVALGEQKKLSVLGWTQPQLDVLRELNREHRKIILYGTTDTGRLSARLLDAMQIDFYGFCSREAEWFPDGLLGKPVLSPDKLVAHGDEYYVVPAISMVQNYKEIVQFLQEHNYPKEHMLGWADCDSIDTKLYFEFPALYRRGSAFIDGGCYDCEDSYRFAEWCEREYSSIIAFEPDPDNYARCCKRVQDVPLPNFQLVNAGLSGQEGTAAFHALNTMGSYIMPADASNQASDPNHISIRTVALDDIAGGLTVGFIKMDIEGVELDALHGAKNTIIRDKPLLAISVYHLQGDLFAIMDYLHDLLPEYRFWLRHYGATAIDTVLYASVDL